MNRRGTGFTLIEMVVSMAVLTILLLACGAVVTMATRVTSDAGTRATGQLQSADGASQIVDDLNVALNFTQRTATAVTFTVPDRLGTGSPQSVAYSWAGTAGSPVVRQFNGGTAVTWVPAAQSFQLGYTTRLMGPAGAATTYTVLSHTTGTTLKDAPIDNKNFAAEYFAPTLPSSASSYSLTKLRIMLKAAGGQDGIITLRVTAPPLLSNPTTNVLGTFTVYESGFSTAYEYVDIPLSGLTGLNPLQTLCFVFSYSSGGGQVGMIETDTALLSILGGCSWSTSTDGGTSWSTASGLTSPMFYVFGTVP